MTASSLNTKLNVQDPDGFYEALINAHSGLTKEESDAFNARLILILANQVGDDVVLKQALVAASKNVAQ